MKTKFKDLLLYTLATIGVVALFISATQTQVSHTTPESHIWEFHSNDNYAINKKTGEIRVYKYVSKADRSTLEDYKQKQVYVVVQEIQ